MLAFICKSEQLSLIIAKNRVAPLKQITLPKLELMAAAATLGDWLLKHIEIIDEIWSDSQIVLHWLETEKQFPRFV